MLSTDNHLAMLFEGSTVQQHLKLSLLMDPRASANLVSPRMLQQLKLSTEPAAAKMGLADNSETAIVGKVNNQTAAVYCYCA